LKKRCDYCIKYKAIYPPKNNCKMCWYMYFYKNPNVIHATQYTIEKMGREAAVNVKGEKFIKFAERYIKFRDELLANAAIADAQGMIK
jgi:hypothetical protein